MNRIRAIRWRRSTATLILVAMAGGLPACNGSEDADGAPGGRSGAALAAGDGQAEQDGGLRVDPERGALTREVQIRVGGHQVIVEIADDPETRGRGLMYRDSLPEDLGMLFVYSEEQILSFWMRNTDIPLDIAFIDRSGFILEIRQMEPHDDASHASRQPAMYALEMRKDWFRDHEVEPGDRVEF